jgi:hypothetical protein
VGTSNETPTGVVPPSPAPGVGSTWLNAIGDIGWCGSQAMPQIARLLTTLPGDILLTGDIAYMNATIDDSAGASTRTSVVWAIA